jgi:hypothetical protein
MTRSRVWCVWLVGVVTGDLEEPTLKLVRGVRANGARECQGLRGSSCP